MCVCVYIYIYIYIYIYVCVCVCVYSSFCRLHPVSFLDEALSIIIINNLN